MNPLIPTPDVLPAPWGVFQGLLMLTFPLHLLLMNALLGTAGLSLYARLKGGETEVRLAHALAKLLPFLVAFTINLGVAPLLFLQVLYGPFLYTSSVLMAVSWLAVPLVLIVAYYAIYFYDFKFVSLGRAGAVPMALAMAIFLVLPFLFTSNMTLMLEPSRWAAYFGNRGGTLLTLKEPLLWVRYLHFVVGGLAVGGLFVAAYGRFKTRTDGPVGALAVRLGLGLFRVLTMAQVLVGFGFLMMLPPGTTRLFMGGGTVPTLLLLLGLLLAILALLAAAKGSLVQCVVLVLPLVYVMAFMRDAVRSAYLGQLFTPAALKVVPQVSPLVLFVLSLAGGTGLVAWMIRQASRAGEGRP